MENKYSLDYVVYFNKVKNLEDVKKGERYLGSIGLKEGVNYAMFIDNVLMKENFIRSMIYCIQEFTNSFSNYLEKYGEFPFEIKVPVKKSKDFGNIMFN